MEILLLLVVIGVIAYLMIPGGKKQAPQQPDNKPIPNRLQSVADMLSKVISDCESGHPDAFPALAWMAASDGTVSRQELRILIGFCERQGTSIEASWKDALEHLNSGMKMSVGGGEKEATGHISALAEMPINYRAAFLGAAEALAASNRTSSAAKNRILEAARKIIEER